MNTTSWAVPEAHRGTSTVADDTAGACTMRHATQPSKDRRRRLSGAESQTRHGATADTSSELDVRGAVTPRIYLVGLVRGLPERTLP